MSRYSTPRSFSATKIEENEQVQQLKGHHGHGSHHWQTVVPARFEIFCSSLAPQAWQFRGISGGSTNARI